MSLPYNLITAHSPLWAEQRLTDVLTGFFLFFWDSTYLESGVSLEFFLCQRSCCSLDRMKGEAALWFGVDKTIIRSCQLSGSSECSEAKADVECVRRPLSEGPGSPVSMDTECPCPRQGAVLSARTEFTFEEEVVPLDRDEEPRREEKTRQRKGQRVQQWEMRVDNSVILTWWRAAKFVWGSLVTLYDDMITIKWFCWEAGHSDFVVDVCELGFKWKFI